MCFGEEIINFLKIFDLEKFALRFYKLPHPEKGLMLSINIFIHYF